MYLIQFSMDLYLFTHMVFNEFEHVLAHFANPCDRHLLDYLRYLAPVVRAVGVGVIDPVLVVVGGREAV